MKIAKRLVSPAEEPVDHNAKTSLRIKIKENFNPNVNPWPRCLRTLEKEGISNWQLTMTEL